MDAVKVEQDLSIPQEELIEELQEFIANYGAKNMIGSRAQELEMVLNSLQVESCNFESLENSENIIPTEKSDSHSPPKKRKHHKVKKIKRSPKKDKTAKSILKSEE